MLRRFDLNYAVLSLVIDALVVIVALGLAAWLRPELRWLPFSQQLSSKDLVPWHLYVTMPLLWVLVFWRSALYDPRGVFRASDEFRALSVGTAFAGLASAGVLYLGERGLSRWLFLLFVAIAFTLLFTWRAAARLVMRRVGRLPVRERRVLVIGAGDVTVHIGQLIQQHSQCGLRLVGYVTDEPLGITTAPVLGGLASVRNVVLANKVDDVVIVPSATNDQVSEIAKALLDIPLQVWIVPTDYMLALDRPIVEDFAGVPLVGLRSGPLSDSQRILKRLFDLVMASIMLLISLPLMVLVALCIRLDSPGPILLRQPRVGENGKLFRMYKFRTMVADAEQRQAEVLTYDAAGRVLHKHPHDPRVTRVGRLLRKMSLDELPQLINVLKGEMSLVGPRPELPWLVERYEPWQRRRLVVPQGLTGWWQVNGRSDRPMHLHTDDDLYYIANYSLGLDLRILWKTIWVILARKGAH